MWLLKVLKGSGRFERGGKRRERLWLPELPVLIGRRTGSESDAQLVGDPAVSRRHVLLEEADAALRVRNESTTNPIWVDGRRVRTGESATIRTGQACQIGRTLIVVEEAEPTEPLRPLTSTQQTTATAEAERTQSLNRLADVAVETEPVTGSYVLLVFDTFQGTHIREVFGNAPIEEWLTYLLHQARQLRCLYIRGTGDGAFLLFRDVRHALTLTVSTMRFLAARNRNHTPEEAVYIRCGIHHGFVKPSALSGYTSLSLDFVYRITAADPLTDLSIPAKGISPQKIDNLNRIWFSEAIARMNVGSQWPARKLGWFHLKNVNGLHPLFELCWEQVPTETLATPIRVLQER